MFTGNPGNLLHCRMDNEIVTDEIAIGETQTLSVIKLVEFGAYLDGQAWGEILLPKRYVPEGLSPGDAVACFLYFDSEDRLIATTETPSVEAGEIAALKIVSVNRVGAFADWGLTKDLLIPYGEQARELREGDQAVVYVTIDKASQRLIGSTKLHRYLPESSAYLQVDQAVELLITERTDLGYKAVIDGYVLGLIHHSDAIESLVIGQSLSGFVKNIRQDRKIDLALRPSQTVARQALPDMILQYLREQGGESTLMDRSAPTEIFDVFQASKGSYKKAIGQLYKARKIELSKDKIRLVNQER